MRLIVILLSGFALAAQTTSKPLAGDASVDSAGERHRQTYRVANQTYVFGEPTFWQTFKYVPDDLYRVVQFTAKKENLIWDAAVLGSTGLLIVYDQPIVEEADRLGKKMGGGWSEDSRYKKFLGLKIVPQNLSSGVYYIGNGGTTILLSGIFYGIGKLNNNDYRALHTSSELLECLISVGVLTQSIKRITGRQSPVRAIPQGNDGGDWQPFPSLSAYQKNTPNYDAMPSGHLATYIATVTVIAINYPELKWVKPIGYSLGALLAFNMVSTKVHWASDYPLAILIGYAVGKNIAERRILRTSDEPAGKLNTKIKTDFRMSHIDNTGLYGICLTF